MNEEKLLFSPFEQHVDGRWWYHPGTTRGTAAEAEEVMRARIGDDRPVKVIAHREPFPQGFSRSTRDFQQLEFCGGYIHIIK